MCIYTYFHEHNDMPHDPLTRVSECSVASSAPEQLMTAMVFQAGVEIRSAMALCPILMTIPQVRIRHMRTLNLLYVAWMNGHF